MPILDAYIRVSKVGDREGDSYRSPHQQREAVEVWAAANDVTIGEVVIDEDASGRKGVKDRKLGALLDRAEAGQSSGVVTYRFNRFGRNMADTVAAVTRLKQAGARLVSVAPDSYYDTDQPSGQVMLGVLSGLAEQQSDERKANWKTSCDEAVAEGKHIACRAPLGYLRRDQVYPEFNDRGKLIKNARLVVDGDIADAIRRAFESRARGDSLKVTAEALASDLGRRVPRSNLSGLLTNPVYMGHARGPNGAVNEKAHEAIVTPELWAAAQRKERNGDRKQRSVRDGSLASQSSLAGIITCASCGRKLQIMGRTNKSNGKRMASYVCTAKYNGLDCEAPAIGDVEKVDQHVFWILSEDGAGAAKGSGNSDALFIEARDRVRQVQDDLDSLVSDRGGVSVTTWKAMVADLERELNEARSVLWDMEDPGLSDDAETVTLDGKTFVYRVWGDDQAADRRALRKLIGSVTLAKCDRRRGWQPLSERVQLRWADGSEPSIPSIEEMRTAA